VIASTPAASTSRAASSARSKLIPPSLPCSAVSSFTHTGKSGPTASRTARDHLQQQPRAIFQTTAISIGPGVGLGRDERGQQIAMPAVELDRIEPGHLGAGRSCSELAHDQIDVDLFHQLDPGHLASGKTSQLLRQKIVEKVALHRRRIARRPQFLIEGIGGKARDQPAMVQLRGNLGAMCVNALCQGLEAG
jgi:hypothetical protein